MIPKIIHYCWFGGGDLPIEYKGYIEGWKELHPDWEIIRWDDTNFKFDESYLQNAKANSKWANVSNYVRLKVLLENGGVYLDTDIKLVKSFNELLNEECFVGFESYEGAELSINGAVIGCIPGHHFIDESYRSLISLYNGLEDANLSCPILLTNILKNKYGLDTYKEQVLNGIRIFERDVFYPLPFDKVHDKVELDKYIKPSTIAVHVWGRSWYSIDELLDRIDNQTIFIEEHLSYIQELEKIIDSHFSELGSERTSYYKKSRDLERIDKMIDSIALSMKNQDHLLYLLNERLGKMESQHNIEYFSASSEIQFLSKRLDEVNYNLTELKKGGQLAEKSFAVELSMRDYAINKTNDVVSELLESQLNIQQSIDKIRIEFNNALQKVYRREGELQELIKRDVLPLVNSFNNVNTDNVESSFLLNEKFNNAHNNINSVDYYRRESSSKEVIKLNAEIAALKESNEALVAENAGLLKLVEDFKSEADLHSEEISNLKFKLNSLKKYIDNFAHVRGEYEHRIAILEELIQKMRLKNRAKRLIGFFKSNKG